MAEQYLTMAEIEARYPNEWGLVDKLKKGRDGFAVGGFVVAHDSEREVVYRACQTLPSRVMSRSFTQDRFLKT